MLKRRNKYSNDIEPEKTDRYLITYSDLITLLLGLFVILYAGSQVDDVKYRELSRAFSTYFNPSQSKSSNGSGMLPAGNGAIPDPIQTGGKRLSLEEIQSKAESVLHEYIEEGTLKVKKTKDGVVVTLPEVLLFSSGKADIQAMASPLLDNLSRVLSGIEMQICISGHTDATPIKSFRFESNWHLSVARATNIAYSLISRGMPSTYLVISGYAEHRPIADNSTEEGRQQNRRVEITINNLPSDAPSTNGYEDNNSLKK